MRLPTNEENELLLEYYKLAEDIIEQAHDKPIYYMPNVGNWGDGLIHAGTIKFFSHFNIPFKSIRSISDLKYPFRRDRLFVYGGGGGWCSLWNHGPKKTIRAIKKFNRVIVLPSTYEGAYKIRGVKLYCRDQYQSLQENPEATFCHDMAFFIGPLTSGETGKGLGSFFRTDEESSDQIDIPDTNLDLSLKGSHKTGVFDFFAHLSPYKLIETDRLHVAIGGCLLDKSVKLYPGKYFKNKAVYESSLKPFYPKCEFLDSHQNVK